jgi:hypothetical protein
MIHIHCQYGEHVRLKTVECNTVRICWSAYVRFCNINDTCSSFCYFQATSIMVASIMVPKFQSVTRALKRTHFPIVASPVAQQHAPFSMDNAQVSFLIAAVTGACTVTSYPAFFRRSTSTKPMAAAGVRIPAGHLLAYGSARSASCCSARHNAHSRTIRLVLRYPGSRCISCSKRCAMCVHRGTVETRWIASSVACQPEEC